MNEWITLEPKRKRSKSAASKVHTEVKEKYSEPLVFEFEEDDTMETPTTSAFEDELDDFSNLVIVTPAPRGPRQSSSVKDEKRRYVQPHSRKGSNSTSAAISDGLYFYEQDLRKNKDPTSEVSANVTTAPVEQVLPLTIEDENVHIYPAKPKKKKPARRRKARTKTPKHSSASVGWLMKKDGENNKQQSHSTDNSMATSPSSTPPGNHIAIPKRKMQPKNSPKKSPAFSPKFGSSPRSCSPSDRHAHPSRSLLEHDGFVQHKYDKFHARCLKGKEIFHAHDS